MFYECILLRTCSQGKRKPLFLQQPLFAAMSKRFC